MEDVLEVYARPVDPARPLVCFDETGKELQRHARPIIPMAPGQPERHDSEYIRAGSVNLFVWTAPLLGTRGIQVSQQRTSVDWARAIRRLVEEDFPDAETIVLVLDNLNTHKASALYQAFPPEVARRIWAKLEVHYTPIHGSWLNIAECELSVLKRQCLRQRFGDLLALECALIAWVEDQNTRQRGVDWRFTASDARITLKRLYPIPIYAK